MITGLLLTRNRLGFLSRALTYYNGQYPYKIVILDASDEAQYIQIRELIGKNRYKFAVELLHHDVTAPWIRRLSEALESISTPYVMLMADDDFYYCDWIRDGVAYLETEQACAAVYGHTIMFALERFCPVGEVKSYDYSRPNPVARWLEEESPLARLGELAKGPWAYISWYSIQRAEVFRKMVIKAAPAQFTQDMFERLQNIMHPIYGKVVMMDKVYLARQQNLEESRAPFSFRPVEGAMETLRKIASEALMEVSQIGEKQARTIIEQALEPEIRQLKYNDFRAGLALERWKVRMPWIARRVGWLKRMRYQLSRVEPLASDSRFALPDFLSDARWEISLLRGACRSQSGDPRSLEAPLNMFGKTSS